MVKTLVFDMDGTIADLYGVDNWLSDLRKEKVRPYAICQPLVDINRLNEICDMFRSIGYKIIITTWLSKDSSTDYKKRVRETKVNWLENVGFKYDEIHLVQYGTTKAKCTKHYGNNQVLIDDNEKVRNGWTLGDTIDANENILEKLVDLFEKVC